MFDAVNSIHGKYEPFLVDERAPKHSSTEAAAAAAAHRALESLYPAQEAALDATYASFLAGVANGPSKANGVQIGQLVADEILEVRQNDGSSDPASYTPKTEPGYWQPTWPTYAPALGAGWGGVDPFTLNSASQFRAPAPPALSSAQYTAAYNQVKELGALDSATRTEEQTEIGHFWAYDRAEMGTPMVLYNQAVRELAVQQRNTTLQNARLFALANLAMGDAGVTAWDTKYTYDFWRPITAIQAGADDGNPDTVGDADWKPLGAPGGNDPDFTPAFPAYTSGHSTFGAATFRILQKFYGRDNIRFTLESDELPGVTRSYDRFSEAAEENGISRIYLGIHWAFDNTEGIKAGRAVADWVYTHALAPKKPLGRPQRPPLNLATDGPSDGSSTGDDSQMMQVAAAPAPSVFSTTSVVDGVNDELLTGEAQVL